MIRPLLAGGVLLALAACSQGSKASNELVVAKEIIPAPAHPGPAADEPTDRPAEPDIRASDLDANALAVAPGGPPPPDQPIYDLTKAPQPALGPAPSLKQLIGDINPAKEPGFAPVPKDLGPKGGMYANAEALKALERMREAAKKDGVEIVVVSAFRSFNDQKRIWDDKWTGKTIVDGGKLPVTTPDPKARATKILEFSAMPGTSRHHWGTDFDLNDLNNAYFASGKGKAEHDWLETHAAGFGFCQTYSPKGPDRPRGYNQEDWHWSYLPIASRYLKAYPDVVGYERLKGFEGADAAKQIDVIRLYVEGINPDCVK